MPRAALAAIWRRAHGRPPPPGISRRLLLLAAAWQLQAERFGGFQPATRRQLDRLAAKGVESTAELLAQRDGADAPAASRLSPGTRLLREWQGRTYAVEVVADGFLYEGRRYGSLSEIARAITGARWSGPRFFGVHRRNGE